MSAHFGDYATVIDASGELQPAPGALITFRDQTDTTLLTLFSDDALTQPLPNPFAAEGVTGRFEAYTATSAKSMLTVQYGSSQVKVIVELIDPSVTAALSNPTLSGDVAGTPSATVIQPGVVTTSKLANGAATGAKLGSDVVVTTTPLIGDVTGLVGATSIPVASITGAKLANNTVTSAQVDSSIEKTINKNANNGYAGLDSAGHIGVTRINPSGTNGQVLTTVAGAVAWATPAAGGGGANAPFQFAPDFQAPQSGDYAQMRCSVATSITAFHAQRTGGTGANMDVLDNGVSILTALLSLTATTDMTGALTANPYVVAAGHILKVVVSAQTGNPSDISTSVEGSRVTF